MNQDISALPTAPASRTLTPLSSGYQEAEHGAYARYLTAGLREPKVFNIALTGGYGSGKSSVIENIENSENFKVLNVAISSLGNDLGEPGSPMKGADEGADLTNRIEKAIVKQLLYREAPEKLPASDFHRLSKFPLGRAMLTSAAGIVGAVAVPVLLGWDPDLLGQGAQEWVTGAVAIGIGTVGLTAMRAFLHQKFSVSQLSAAGASVTLARRPTSYFDKYLAEIVYFFEATDYDVVVFEDLDRFENPGIFEALRELNTLLNESDQVGRKVRFVYAVRDSVFEKLGRDPDPTDSVEKVEEEASSGSSGVAAAPNSQGDVDAAQAEVERANRTKFFDLVIPLVPFITHRSAHELLAQLFPKGEAHRPSDELIDRVARHVPDMRMLKNIRNEYCVFSEQLLVMGKGAPDLSPDTLLSLVLYKQFHLADFEKIVHGRSDLDILYKAYRATINDSIRDADDQLRALDSADAVNSAAQTRAEELGARFNELVDVARADRKLLSIAAGDTDFGTQVTDWLKFWRQAAADGSITVTVNRQGYANSPQPLEFKTAMLERLLDHSLTVDAFDTWATASVEEQRRKHRANRDFLRGASMAKLNGRTEFTERDTGLPLANVVGKLKSKLARELVREGDIDHNFTLYVGQFYGNRLSKDVQTFILRNVDTNTPDANYQLKPDEVVSLLAEAGPRCLRGASAYNVSILDHLLEQHDPQADFILDRLAGFGEAEQSFVETYLSNGAHPDLLSAGLARRWPHTLVYLAHEAQLEAGRRVTYVDAALRALSSEISYDTAPALGEFLATNYAAMASYIGELQRTQVHTIVNVTRESGASIADLSALHSTMLSAIVESDLYPLTATNLRVAIGDAPSIALDRMQGDSALYEDCLEQPAAFLAAVADDDATNFTIDEPQHFAAILGDVADRWDAQHIEALIEDSSPTCEVTRLAEAPKETWAPLAKHHRFPATITNIEDYRAEHGIDDALGDLLAAAETLEVNDEAAQSDLRALAAALLNSPTAIPDPAHRVRLAQSLGLADPLEPSDVPAEAGRLLSLLLAAGLLADTAETFARFATTDWATIESAMTTSAAFGENLSPAILPGPLVKDFLLSTAVSEELKAVVLSRSAEFIGSSGMRV
ncbi:hypothetical protein [Georgenia sp. 1P01AC]|uniref:YobI family P-loop NTPase n=1 Tax=Georgenia sp. 1P01AC TaxID=554103 RepID=UPI0039AFDB71